MKNIRKKGVKMTVHHRYHPYEEEQAKGYKNQVVGGGRKKKNSNSTGRKSDTITLDQLTYMNNPKILTAKQSSKYFMFQNIIIFSWSKKSSVFIYISSKFRKPRKLLGQKLNYPSQNQRKTTKSKYYL